jgi:hypothetical protein
LERRRQRRRRVGVLGGLTIGVVVLIVVAAVVFGVHKVVTHHSATKRTQTTVLMQIQGPDNTAEASVLLAHGPGANEGVEVLIPSRVITTTVCGYNSLDFGDVLALPNGATESRQALSTMLGEVTVDGSWTLTPSQLEKLIDGVGGIRADVDVNVVQRNPGGGATVLVPEGNDQKLSGKRAVEYATYTASAHEDAPAQLLRLQLVVDGMLQSLRPKSPTMIAALLRQLGGGGASTLGATRLTTFLAGLAADNQSASGLFASDLPETPIDAGGAPSYSLDTSPSGVPELVRDHLADSVPAGTNTARPTVELLNGVGTPNLVRTACPLLSAHGFAYAGSGNAGAFNIARSTVQVPASKLSLGYQVASALGLPRDDVERSSEDQSVANVIVTLGGDYPTPKPKP